MPPEDESMDTSGSEGNLVTAEPVKSAELQLLSVPDQVGPVTATVKLSPVTIGGRVFLAHLFIYYYLLF